MGMYKDLNEIEIDLSEFEVATLTKLEKKRVQKIVKKKLKLVKPRKGAGVAAAAVLAIGLLAVNHQTIANHTVFTFSIVAFLSQFAATATKTAQFVVRKIYS